MAHCPTSLNTLQKYLITDEPGLIVAFDVHTSVGKLQISYLLSKTFDLGSVDCWVDAKKSSGKRLDGYWDSKDNIVQ